ncbi:MAG: DNA-directed RNA polymerase subunit K [Candidatus Aenigmarchaeota archaeon]
MKDPNSYTRYEKTRIISARALQISQGSPILVDIPKGVTKPLEVAKLEWEAGLIPIDVKRRD